MKKRKRSNINFNEKKKKKIKTSTTNTYSAFQTKMKDHEKEMNDISNKINVNYSTVKKICSMTIEIENVHHKLINYVRSKREINLVMSIKTDNNSNSINEMPPDDIKSVITSVTDIRKCAINDELVELLKLGIVSKRKINLSKNYNILIKIIEGIKQFQKKRHIYVAVYNLFEYMCMNKKFPKDIYRLSCECKTKYNYTKLYDQMGNNDELFNNELSVFRVLLYVVRFCKAQDSSIIEPGDLKTILANEFNSGDAIDIMYDQNASYEKNYSLHKNKNKKFQSKTICDIKSYKEASYIYREAAINEIFKSCGFTYFFPSRTKDKDNAVGRINRLTVNQLHKAFSKFTTIKTKIIDKDDVPKHKDTKTDPKILAHRRAIRMAETFTGLRADFLVLFRMKDDDEISNISNNREMSECVSKYLVEMDNVHCKNKKCNEKIKKYHTFCFKCAIKQ